MAKAYYQTTKVVKVTEPTKVIVRSPGIAGPKGDPGTRILSGPGKPSNIIGSVGDMYVDVTHSIMYGPKSLAGWNTDVPLFEGFNKDLLGQVFSVSLNQTSTEIDNGESYCVWTIQHNLGYNPNATCLDSSGAVIEGEISYPDENTIVLRFIGATSGKAYLS